MTRPTVTDMLDETEGKLERYAWPGGYDIAYYTSDGDTLCADCATEALKPDEDGGDPSDPPVAFDYDFEETDWCADCGKQLGPEPDDEANE